MKKKVELLAPAGDRESLVAAVNSGADAVYMGLPDFNARYKAVNFTKEDFPEAVEYAISHGVKVYLTINTLITDEEMQRAISSAIFAARAGVSAFIIQDIGLMKELQKRIEGVEFHASTQMSVVDYCGAQFLYEQGCERVVLSRELSLQEIARIGREFKGELEVFVHGALCYSYSGQCLMSSLIGNRSGNRGLCAQPCRLPYKSNFTGDRAHLLSLKDLNALENLKPLIDAGVSSLKIEGRMKGATYTAGVVSIYRKYIDQILQNKYKGIDIEDVRELEQLFNRGGFTNGYLQNKDSTDRIYSQKAKNKGTYLGKALDGKKEGLSLKIKLAQDLDMGDGMEVENQEQSGGVVSMIRLNNQHVRHAPKGATVIVEKVKGSVMPGAAVFKTSSKLLNDRINERANKEIKVKVYGSLSLKIGEPMGLKLGFDGTEVYVKSENAVEEAKNSPMSKERICQALCKSGDYPYDLSQVSVYMDSRVFVPVSQLNEIRRKACDALYSKYLKAKRNVRITNTPLHGNAQRIKSSRKVDILIYKDVDRHLDSLKGYKPNKVFLPINCTKEQVVKALDFDLGLWIPNCVRNRKLVDDKIAWFKSILKGRKINLLLGSLGDLKYTRDEEMNYSLNYGFNIFNSYSSEFFRDYERTVSVELDKEMRKHILIDDKTYFLGYGRVTAMTSATCVRGGNNACENKGNFIECCTKQEDYLEDRVGKKYQVLKGLGGCGSIILSCGTLNQINDIPDYASIRIDLSDEDDALVRKLLAANLATATK